MKTLPSNYTAQFKPENLTEVKEIVPVEDDMGFPDPPPAPEPDPEPVQDRSFDAVEADEFDYDAEDDGDPVRDFITDIGGGGEGMDQKGREAFAEMVVGMVGLGKGGINFFFETQLDKELEAKFRRSDEEILYTVIALDQEDSLTLDELRKTADNTKHELKDLLRVKVAYVNLKKQWQTSEYDEKIQDGIRMNATRVAEKYFGESEPNPLLMLGLFILVALGVDVARLGFNVWNANRQSQAS